MIISPEIYDNAEQKKIIPIIFERDEDGEAFTPIYIKSRLYFDLSENVDFEDGYNQLARCIYNKPLKKKPPLGAKPALLDDTNINLHGLRDVIKKFKKSKSSTATKVLAKQFLRSYISVLKEIHSEKFELTKENAIEAVTKLKPIRDLYIDFLEACVQAEILTADLIVEFLSEIYNEICKVTGHQIIGEPFADIRFLLWEMLLCSVAILYSYSLYEQIYLLACSPVYVRRMYFASDLNQEHSITVFSRKFGLIEQAYIEQDKNRENLISPCADFLSTREKQPNITKEILAFSDVLLWHVTQVAYIKGKVSEIWWPVMRHYDTKSRNEWVRLSSTKFCSNILPLFGADSIEMLKDSLVKAKKITPEQLLSYDFHHIANLVDIVPIERIATSN